MSDGRCFACSELRAEVAPELADLRRNVRALNVAARTLLLDAKAAAENRRDQPTLRALAAALAHLDEQSI